MSVWVSKLGRKITFGPNIGRDFTLSFDRHANCMASSPDLEEQISRVWKMKTDQMGESNLYNHSKFRLAKVS